MTTIYIILIIIACFILGFFILVQKPKGGGLSGSFGSLGAQVMGVQKSGDAMEKGTWYTITIIAVLSIASTFALPNLTSAPQQELPANEQPAAPASNQPLGGN